MCACAFFAFPTARPLKKREKVRFGTHVCTCATHVVLFFLLVVELELMCPNSLLHVEDIIKKVGSSDITYDEMEDGYVAPIPYHTTYNCMLRPGHSSHVRRSTLKARKLFTTQNPYNSLEPRELLAEREIYISTQIFFSSTRLTPPSPSFYIW